MALSEATASLVHQVFARLVRDKILPREIFEGIETAHDKLADETTDSRKRAAAIEVSVVARLILDLAGPPPPKPSLKLVRPDQPTDE